MARTDFEDMFNKSEKRNWLEFHVAMDQMKLGLHRFVFKQMKRMHKSLVKKVGRRERCSSCRSDDIIWNGSKKTWSFSSPCPSNLCDTWLKEILSLHKTPKSKRISWQDCDVTSWPSKEWEVIKVFLPKGQPPLKKNINQCGVNDLLSLLVNCTYLHKYASEDCLRLLEKVSDERNAIYRSGLIELAEDKRKKLFGFIIEILEDPVTFSSIHGCKKSVENIRKIDHGPTYTSLKQDDIMMKMPGNDSSLSKELKVFYNMIERKHQDIETQIKRSVTSEEKMNLQFESPAICCEESKLSQESKFDTGIHQDTSSSGDYYCSEYDEKTFELPSVQASKSVPSQNMEEESKKQHILEHDRVMGATAETLHEDKIQIAAVERGFKLLGIQSRLYEGEVLEHGSNIQDHDSHPQGKDALPKDQQTHQTENVAPIQEVGFNALVNSNEMQAQDIRLKVHETETKKPEDHRTSDWRKEIKEICSESFCREKLELYLSEKRNDMALENILQHILKTKDKEALDILLMTISKEWRKNHCDQKIVVWLGLDHRGKRKVNEIFVCFHSADIVSKFSKFLGLPIIYRRLEETEMEPLENRLNEKYQKVSLKKEDAANIKCLINEVGDDLFKCHRNLEAISASSVKSRKKGILQLTSIVLYCRLKSVVPFEEDFFPKELKINDQIYPTDVREGFVTLGMIPGQNQSITLSQVLNPTLRMGCSIGPSTAKIGGTLGPFVKDKDNNIGFLTCAHVLGLNTPVGTAVCQPALCDPGPTDDTRLCGALCKSKFDFSNKPSVDAALVLVDQSKREYDSAGFVSINLQQLREAGFSEDDSPSYVDGGVIAHADFDQVDGKRVIKIGGTSGLTRGTFALDGAMLKIHDAELKLPESVPCPQDLFGKYFLMKSQFIIHTVGNNSFFSLGDSGSGVYLVERRGVENKLILIGIAIGALSPSECVVTPIGAVLEALELDESCIITECRMQH